MPAATNWRDGQFGHDTMRELPVVQGRRSCVPTNVHDALAAATSVKE